MTAAVVDQPVFVKRPPWRTWCDLVAQEAKGQGTARDVQLVRQPENLIGWIRALNQISLDVDAQISDSRLRLKAIAPLPGHGPTEEYLLAKADHDRRHAGRVRFRRSIEARLDEARHLTETAGVNPHRTVGFLLTSIARAEELLARDDVESALSLLRTALDKAGAGD